MARKPPGKRELNVKGTAGIKGEALRQEIADTTKGLYLVVQPSGAKSWAFRYRFNGKPCKLTMGKYAEKPVTKTPIIGGTLSLSQARKLAGDLRLDVENGTDPSAVKKTAKAKALDERSDANTIDAAVVAFLTGYTGRKKVGMRDTTRTLYAHYLGMKREGDAWTLSGGGVLQYWTGKPLRSITMDDAESTLAKLPRVSANRTLTLLKTFWRWCIKRRRCEVSPVDVLDRVNAERSRETTLTDNQLAALWRSTGTDGDLFGAMVRMLVLTGGRRDEVREAPRAEFDKAATVALPDGKRWKGALWALPAERAKNGHEHLMPLSALAVETLSSIPAIKGKRLLLTLNGDTPLSNLSRAKGQLDERMRAELGDAMPDWTLHDLRRTFVSGLQRLGFPVEVADACVNHRSGKARSGVTGVYARYEYFAEKAAAFDAWSSFVRALIERKPATVASIVVNI